MKPSALIPLLLMTFYISAQQAPLKRKASLGVMFEGVNDSIAKANGLKKTEGLYMRTVMAGSAAENAFSIMMMMMNSESPSPVRVKSKK